MHLEMHKMTRKCSELVAKHAAAEAECTRLRRVIAQESEKHAATHAAAVQQFNHATDLEREKTNAMQRSLERERVRMMEQMHQESVAQRQSNADALVAIKRTLDAQINATLNEVNCAAQQSMQQADEERQRIKRDETEQRAQLDKEREQMHQQLDEARERIKRDEHEQLFQFALRMDSEREQMQKERERLTRAMEQLNGDEREQRAQLINERERIKRHEQAQLAKLNEDARALNDLKKQLNDAHAEKMNELAAAFDMALQKMNEEREQFNRKLMEEREQFNRKLMEEREHLNRKLIEERDNINRNMLDHVRDSITATHAHVQLICSMDLKDTRVAVYSHYSEHNEVESYNLLNIECIEHYFDCIIILTNCPNKWNLHSPNYNKCHLLGYNLKSDFRNYGVFLMQAAKTLIHASRLCFINDSFVIVDVSAFGNCIKRLFDADQMSHDFIGLTSSHEGVFHLQSYFMCFGAPTIPAILSYFETRGLPMNHQTAISNYELGITAHLTNLGFSSFAVVSNDDMRFPLNTTCCKWPAVLEHVGIIKRQHFLKLYPRRLAMTEASIALVAEKHSYNKHFIDFLKYHRIDVLPA